MNGSRRKPHILMLAPCAPPFKGAVSSRLSSLAKYWSPLTQVTVVSPYCGDLEGSGYSQIKFPLARCRLEPLRIPFTSPKLVALAKRLKPDVIFASIPPVWPLMEGYLLTKRLGVPLVLDVRDLPQADVRKSKIRIHRQILNASTVFISRHLGRKANKIITVTDWIREELIRFLGCAPKKISVIRNGSETLLFQKALSVKKEFDIVYSGTLIYIRNPYGIVRYLRFLADRYPDLRVLFISSLDKEFLAEIRRLGLNENVVIKGMVNPEQLPKLLGCARLGLNALLPGYDAYRGAIGTKEYEYLAAGLPVIGLMDLDFYVETRRLIADNQVGILDQDPKCLAAKTAALLKDPVRLRRMSRQARAIGERFDRKRLAEDYYYKVILPAWQEFNAKG